MTVTYLAPDWDAPPNVRAAVTLRGGGASPAPYASLNLGLHVGDDPSRVTGNRRALRAALELPAEPLWLEQVHGTRVADFRQATAATPADAAIAREPGQIGAVLVADCLPVFLAARRGDAVAVAHAGWRGLSAGVLEATVAAFGVPGARLVAWLGPAISAAHFEVGDEVRAVFIDHDSAAAAAFVRNARGRWQCDLYALARQRLTALGIGSIRGGTWCTYADPGRFYSFRRDRVTGRMAALIWMVE